MKASIAVAVLALAACADQARLAPGVSREPEVIAKFGAPAERRQLSDGARVLEFPREPEGMENWRATLAPDGTLRSVEQVIDEPYFAKVLPGMTRNEVLQLLGRPSEEQSYPRLGEDVVSWRYMEFGSRIMFFNAHFGPSGRLTHTSRTPDPTVNQGSTEM